MNEYNKAIKHIEKYKFIYEGKLEQSRQCGKVINFMEEYLKVHCCLYIIHKYRKQSYRKYKNKKGVR